MPIVQGIPLRDLKVLSARALGYGLLCTHQINLFTSADHSEKPLLRTRVLQAIDAVDVLAAAEDDTSFNDFLLEYSKKLAETLGNFFAKPAPTLGKFVEELEVRAGTGWSVLDEVSGWFVRLRTRAQDYLRSYGTLGAAMPDGRLLFDINEKLQQAIGARTEIEGTERVVTLFFNVERFDFDAYFSILYTLSHEVWCHCTSNLVLGQSPSGTTMGCSPLDSWEEGWMDYLQKEILEWEMENFVEDSALHPTFSRALDHYSSFRLNPQNGVQRSSGWDSGNAFHRFMRQRFTSLGDAMFVQLSLDMNALGGDNHFKRDFVRWIGDRVGTTATPFTFVGRAEDVHRMTSREALYRLLLSTCKQTEGRQVIDITKLIPEVMKN